MARSSTNISFSFDGTQEETKRATEMVRELLNATDGPFYDSWECGDFLEELGMDYDSAEDFGVDVCAAILKEFSNNKFCVSVNFNWLCSEGSFSKRYTYDGQTLHYVCVENPNDFDGSCPECGETILDNIEDWEKGTVYTCPECGEEILFDDLAEGYEVFTSDESREDFLKRIS